MQISLSEGVLERAPEREKDAKRRFALDMTDVGRLMAVLLTRLKGGRQQVGAQAMEV